MLAPTDPKVVVVVCALALAGCATSPAAPGPGLIDSRRWDQYYWLSLGEFFVELSVEDWQFSNVSRTTQRIHASVFVEPQGERPLSRCSFMPARCHHLQLGGRRWALHGVSHHFDLELGDLVILDSSCGGGADPCVRQYLGFAPDGRLVCVRQEDLLGERIALNELPVRPREASEPVGWMGPPPPEYDVATARAILRQDDPVEVLELLSWLSAIVVPPAGAARELLASVQRDPHVWEALVRLEESPIPWIAEAARAARSAPR